MLKIIIIAIACFVGYSCYCCAVVGARAENEFRQKHNISEEIISEKESSKK